MFFLFIRLAFKLEWLFYLLSFVIVSTQTTTNNSANSDNVGLIVDSTFGRWCSFCNTNGNFFFRRIKSKNNDASNTSIEIMTWRRKGCTTIPWFSIWIDNAISIKKNYLFIVDSNLLCVCAAFEYVTMGSAPDGNFKFSFSFVLLERCVFNCCKFPLSIENQFDFFSFISNDVLTPLPVIQCRPMRSHWFCLVCGGVVPSSYYLFKSTCVWNDSKWLSFRQLTCIMDKKEEEKKMVSNSILDEFFSLSLYILEYCKVYEYIIKSSIWSKADPTTHKKLIKRKMVICLHA